MADRSLVVRIIGDSSSLQRELRRSSSATKQFDRDFSHATRGVIAGSGVFRSLGRSLAFASGGFLAFGGAASFLRTSVDAAKEAQVANAQLATQLQNSGKAFADYRDQIDHTISSLSALAGIEDDELKAGLTTILRTVPDVSKALRDLGTAADLARARHISLGAAATIIAKTEAGNTTLLRRQGFQIAKNATAEQALARVREVVAGQAAAGTTQQERFGAVLHQTEETIGTALLPTLNKYLESGTRWLQQMNESGKLQKDVADAADTFAAAVGAAASAVKAIDKVTGSFKNTLELLLALKVASKVAGWAAAMNLFAASEKAVGTSAVVSRIAAYTGAIEAEGAAATAATGRTLALRSALLKLGAIGVVTLGVEVLLNKKSIDNAVSGFLDSHHLGFLGGSNKIDLPANITIPQLDKAIAGLKKLKGEGDLTVQALEKIRDRMQQVADAAAVMQHATTGLGPHHDDAFAAALKAATAAAADVAASGSGLSASQKNTFFDNAIARILLRGGLGDIQRQIASLEKADALIEQRLKVTKDITRRLNLEDELLQNQAEIRDLKVQLAADALQKHEEARQAALDALERRAEARAKALAALTAKQFRQLGLSSTGDAVTPSVAALKRRLAQLSSSVSASSLNTPKLQTELARFRKVLSEGLVPKDVRAKIKDMMDEIRDQLNQGLGAGNVTRFAHANTLKLLAGLGLTPELKRELERRIAQIGVGGTVPGVSSASFAGAGASNPVVVHTTVNLDGKKVAQNTTSHQRRQNQRRADARRGPYAGRH